MNSPPTTKRRWRWRVLRLKGPDLVGAWCPSHDEARDDALLHGMVKYDMENGWFFDVFTSLEAEPLEDEQG